MLGEPRMGAIPLAPDVRDGGPPSARLLGCVESAPANAVHPAERAPSPRGM
jgi:hypothetical protein